MKVEKFFTSDWEQSNRPHSLNHRVISLAVGQRQRDQTKQLVASEKLFHRSLYPPFETELGKNNNICISCTLRCCDQTNTIVAFWQPCQKTVALKESLLDFGQRPIFYLQPFHFHHFDQNQLNWIEFIRFKLSVIYYFLLTKWNGKYASMQHRFLH